MSSTVSPRQAVTATHTGTAGVSSCDDQANTEPQRISVAAALLPGQGCRDTHPPYAGDGSGQTGPDYHLIGAAAELLVLGDALNDLENARIAAEGRARALRQDKGLKDSPATGRMDEIANALGGLEHKTELALKRAVRKHPLYSFAERTPGIGEKQFARMLKAIGDPATRPNVAKLWQYCGHGDPARSRRRKGVPCEFNPEAKMRVYLIAEACMKCVGTGNKPRSPYRDVYDQAREAWTDRDTSDGHKHAHALRMVGKAILRDLWLEARS